MNRPLLCFFAALATLTAVAAPHEFASPNGQIVVNVNDTEGCPTYTVSLDGTTILLPSPLGLKTNVADLTTNLSLTNCETKTINDSYTLGNIKQSRVEYTATEATCHFARDGRPVLDIVFRVSDRDVAFRYQLFPRRDTRCCIVEEEASGFLLPEGTTTFLCPQSKPMGGFARTSPSYETPYSTDQPMGTNGWGEGFTFPCLFKAPLSQGKDSAVGWVLISESGVDGSYCGSRLLNVHDGLYRIGFPQSGENNGLGSTTPGIPLPGHTPWRTITIGKTLANIVETTVAFDLVAPRYEASRPYTYGKGSWSWIIGMDNSCNYDEQRRYIDFSAAMGYQSVLIDAFWDQRIGYERIAELAQYGKTKGVGLFLWYNSNGYWNDAPQTPIGKMNNAIERRREMAWMQRVGIRGIKVDFFGGDKQPMMQLYEDILADANDYGLLVIFHGCTLPRGWERMYPNYAASEAVLASENLHFSQDFCNKEAFNACIHPFIRNTVGSMDFGGSALNKFYSADNQHGSRRMTSDVFALSVAVLFQSAVQHFALAPNNLDDAPSWAIDFMKEVPTTWDEVKFIDGYPGKYVILARRHGDKWYVAGVNADAQPYTATLSLPFIEAGTPLRVYSDDKQNQGSMKTMKLPRQQRIKVTIPQNGGLVIVN